MRRWVAILFLLLVAFYLGMCPVDRCDESPREQGQVCHILCNDGCATAPIPVAPVAPAQDPLGKRVYVDTMERPVLSFDLEPEQAPPRA